MKNQKFFSNTEENLFFIVVLMKLTAADFRMEINF